MGSSLDEFNVGLEFDAEGKVRSIEYRDGYGCGHSALFSNPETKLREVVDYHLAHYKRSHKMEPSRRCIFTLPHPHSEAMQFYCVLEPHEGDDHELRTRKVQA